MLKATILIAGPTVLYVALGVLRRMLFQAMAGPSFGPRAESR